MRDGRWAVKTGRGGFYVTRVRREAKAYGWRSNRYAAGLRARKEYGSRDRWLEGEAGSTLPLKVMMHISARK